MFVRARPLFSSLHRTRKSTVAFKTAVLCSKDDWGARFEMYTFVFANSNAAFALELILIFISLALPLTFLYSTI